jgi:regulatory protein
VYIDEDYAFSVHEDVLIRQGLAKGMELDQASMDKLLGEEEKNRAMHSALYYLKFRSRSQLEIRQQLRRKGFAPGIIDLVAAELSDKGYIQDEQFAIQWVQYRMVEQSKGRRWVIQELKEKGIGEPLISQALDRIDQQTEYDKALKIAAKRWGRYRGEPWPDVQRKVGQYLLRQGYIGETVYSVLNEVYRWWEEQSEV